MKERMIKDAGKGEKKRISNKNGKMNTLNFGGPEIIL